MRAVWWIAVALVGCGGGDDGDDGAPDDRCPAFTRIVDATFSQDAENFTWTIEVEGIPAELTIDQEAVAPFVQEYLWGVMIDTDGDGMPNFEVSAKHFKAEQPERVVADITTVTQNAVWMIDGPVGGLTGIADVTLAGTRFTLVLPVDEEPGLAAITADTAMTVETYYQYGRLNDFCRDMSEL